MMSLERMFKFFLIILLYFINVSNSEAQDLNAKFWVDSIMEQMSEEQRIAQLLMVSAYSNKSISHTKGIEKLIKDYHIGGIMFLQGGPVRQARLTNYYQSQSKVPLFVAMDAEWGISMRLDSSIRFPWQMSLGAIKDKNLIYKMGEEIARQCKLIGVNINFSPVVDINFNPNNPIIGNRSFGEDPRRVGELGIEYMKGMQDNKVLACAKHFPGHGDTDTDSHKQLPLINHSKKRLLDVEILPFKMMIDQGLGSVMVAHLHVPALDKTKDLASSLSKGIVTDLLKETLEFKGLVITDALNMKGVSKYHEPGIVDVKALLAGNDILLFSEDVPKAIDQIKIAIKDKKISQKEIDNRCRKILFYKYWMGLNTYNPSNLKEIKNKLTTNHSVFLNRELVENSITLLKNKDDIIPLKKLDTLKIASLTIGLDGKVFQNMLSKYGKIDHFHIDESAGSEEKGNILSKLAEYNLVIVSVHKSNSSPWRSYKISRETDLFIQRIGDRSKLIVSVFASPYSINSFSKVKNFEAFIMSYQNSSESMDLTAQSIFGGIGIKGNLPVSTKHFVLHSGLRTNRVRLKYSMPEEFGVTETDLYKIDSLINDAILKKATPGCQILIAKKGKVVFQRSYGHHTYERKRLVKNTDVYDLASITKISSTVPLIMKMVDEDVLSLNDKIRDYLFVDKLDRKRLIIRDILAHQAGLKSWIPFYLNTLDSDTINNIKLLRDTLYNSEYSSLYPVKVANNIYLHYSYPDTILKIILFSEITDGKNYKYSDLGYYLLQNVIEGYYSKLYSEKYNLDDLVQLKFYKPLGMENMTYLPLNHLNKDRIVPTENDKIFRKQIIHGYVHDQGAAMMGGVAGHAGVFSNANDLAKLMQMYLNDGVYGGERYIQSKTIKEFTKCQFCYKNNRRGAGFDKPSLTKGGNTCQCVSRESFGHTGFTGTIAWADPETEIIYIFLSNRIHPKSENRKLITMNVRTNIMQEVFNIFKNE